MAIQIATITTIDPNLEGQIQHLAIKDPRLYEALTKKKKVSLEVAEDALIINALKTAETGQRVEIDGVNGIRIYDATNNLNVHLNATALIIKTAVTGQRVEIDPVNGFRVFSAGGLQTNFNGATVVLPNQVILNQHILDGAVSELKIAAAAVTEAKVAVSAITSTKIADDAVITAKILAGAVIADKLAADSVTSAKIVAGAVTTAKINAGAVTANEIASGTIVAGNIATGTITADKMNVSTLSAITANIGEVTSGTITGLLFRTAATGQRVEIDGTNGFRVFESLGGLTAQFNGTTLSITGGTIDGGTITGTLVRTATTGERVHIDSSNGIRVFNSSDAVVVQMRPSTFAGVITAGVQGLASTDLGIYVNSSFPRILLSDTTATDEIFLNSGANDRGGYFDNQGGSGSGNQPTDFVLYFQGSGGSRTARRVNVEQGTSPGAGYLYISA